MAETEPSPEAPLTGSAFKVEAHMRGCARSARELRALLRADLFRYEGSTSAKSAIKNFLFTPGFKYTVWMRTCGYLKTKPLFRRTLYPLVKLILLRCRYKYGIAIPEYTRIGPGLLINRFGGIYIGGDAVIGCNVNITHGVLLGYTNRGARAGAPVVGDRCFLGAGAKVIGHVRLGNRSSIGANAVVSKDVEDGGVAVGIPAKVISLKGSDGYVNRCATPEMIAAAGWTEFSL